MSYDPSDPAPGSPPPGGPPPPPPGYDPPGYGQAPPPPPGYGQAPGSYAPGQQPSYPPPPPPDYGYPQPGFAQAPQWGGARLASWGQRAVALLIDAAAVLGLILAVLAVAAILSAASDALGAVVGVLGYVAVFGFGIWNLGVRQGSTGQSIGKRQMKLHLLGEQTGQPVGVGLGVGRYLLRTVLGICGLFTLVDYLFPLWDAKRQTLTDKMVKTVVTTE